MSTEETLQYPIEFLKNLEAQGRAVIAEFEAIITDLKRMQNATDDEALKEKYQLMIDSSSDEIRRATIDLEKILSKMPHALSPDSCIFCPPVVGLS
jgi:hypothetical protein